MQYDNPPLVDGREVEDFGQAIDSVIADLSLVYPTLEIDVTPGSW